MNLSEWLSYLTTLHPSAIALGLDRVRIVAQALNCLSTPAKVITVTGTNGKGTTIAYLEAMLLASGCHVATYTSPHVLVFNERMRLDGKNVADTDLVRIFEYIERVRQSLQVDLTYFEFTTLAAFCLFQERTGPNTVWLLEVGMGGRLDAVNLIDADIAVVTSISYDHTEWLGETLEAIAAEKAGILRAGQTVVIGLSSQESPVTLTNAATQLNTNAHYLNKDFAYEQLASGEWRWCSWVTGEEVFFQTPALPEHSASLALMAYECVVTAWSIPKIIKSSLRAMIVEETTLLGRNQRFLLQEDIHLLMDVAHNPASVQRFRTLWQRLPGKGRRHALVAFLSDKDYETCLLEVLNDFDVWHVATLPGPRGESAEKLMALLERLLNARQKVVELRPYESVTDACEKIPHQMKSGDKIGVFGSFLTVSEALSYHTNKGSVPSEVTA